SGPSPRADDHPSAAPRLRPVHIPRPMRMRLVVRIQRLEVGSRRRPGTPHRYKAYERAGTAQGELRAVSTPTVVRYEPRGAARALFATRAVEVILDGPAGTGKTVSALYRLHLAALKNPGIRCLIVRKTAVSLGSTTLVTYEKKVAKGALAERVVRWYGGSPKEAAAFKYSNGSCIVVGGMDKPEKIMSSEYDLVFADEATELTVSDWEAILTRLRHGLLPWQQIIAACNPAHEKHWLNQRAKQGGMTRLVSRHRDNPAYVTENGALTDAGVNYFAILDKLTGVRRLRLK